MYTDPISDYLTRLRNALMAGHKIVVIPASKTKLELTRILHELGYILSYKEETEGVSKSLKIALKYDPITKAPAIMGLQRASRPGLRKYAGSKELPRVKNGLGIAIVSTSHGVMTDKQARKDNVGGEVLCYVY